MDTGGGRVRQLTHGPLSRPDRPGRRARTTTTRVSKEPERPRRFHRQSGLGDWSQLPGPRWDAHDRGEQTTGDTMVSAREEFRTGRDGRRGVGASHSIVEAGEPSERTPWRRGPDVMTPLEGNMAGASKPGTVYLKQQRSRRRVRDGKRRFTQGAVPERAHDMRSRMRKCKYGICGSSRGAIPGRPGPELQVWCPELPRPRNSHRRDGRPHRLPSPLSTARSRRPVTPPTSSASSSSAIR